MIKDIRHIEKPEDLPGQQEVAPRHEPQAAVVAAAAGAAWPPLILTLLIWPPDNWLPGLEMDWRLMLLGVGVFAVPAGIWTLRKERERTGRPRTRLGIVWRFMLYGGLLLGALQALLALLQSMIGWLNAGDVGQAAGYTETALLIYGVGLLPLAVMVGVSYALWAGLCVAFLAYRPKPRVRDRLGLLDDEGTAG